MKKLLILSCLFLVCYDGFVQPHTCLTKTEAEKILGGPSSLVDKRSAQKKSNYLRYTCTWLYHGRGGLKAGDSSHLYYMLEIYPDTAEANKIYDDMAASNRRMPGAETITGMGDEAWVHTDGNHFQLLIMRKANRLLRIKINKTTQRTSMEELKKAGRQIAASL
jgi:hypothetical protein